MFCYIRHVVEVSTISPKISTKTLAMVIIKKSIQSHVSYWYLEKGCRQPLPPAEGATAPPSLCPMAIDREVYVLLAGGGGGYVGRP